ncbi:anion permease [Enterovibrio sp. Hal110]
MYYLGLPLAMVVLMIFYSIPTPDGITFEGKMSLGIFSFALILWVSESLPNYATSMISIALLSILGGWAEEECVRNHGLRRDLANDLSLHHYIGHGKERIG